jgi:hypothetical protein
LFKPSIFFAVAEGIPLFRNPYALDALDCSKISVSHRGISNIPESLCF